MMPVDVDEEGEESEEKLRMVATRTITSWAENSSCNGVPNIQRATHLFRRFCWLVVVLAGTALTAWQVITVIINFKSYPVNIHMIMDFSSSLAFPTVSICNANQVRKSSLPRFENLLGDILQYSYGRNVTTGMETNAGRSDLRQRFDRKWSMVSDQDKFEAGHQKDRMILDCSFGGKPCGSENFTFFYNSLYGNCYAFNTGWAGEKLLKTHKPGPSSGLVLELFVEQEEYVVELTESAGIRLLVHLQDEMPFPEDGSVLLSPGFMTIFSIRMTNISRLPYPYPSKCWDMEPQQAKTHSVYSELLPYVEYSQQGCYKTCYQAHVIGTCNCGDPSLPLEGDAIKTFMADKSKPIVPCDTLEQYACEEMVKARAKADQITCNCSSGCNEIIFKTSASQAMWPNEGLRASYYEVLAANNPHIAHIFQNDSNMPGPRASLVKVQLYYEQLNQELIKEQASYTYMTLFGDIGGIIGFYLGLSIVAMFEFFELLFDLFTACCKSLLKKKVTQGTSNEKS